MRALGAENAARRWPLLVRRSLGKPVSRLFSAALAAAGLQA
jgi:hypothetical protein